jgi:hypothetical protein
MKLSELKDLLRRGPESGLRFILPSGRPIPEDFHVTEVGHATRKFMDCGGTVRSSEACVLQVWRTDNDKGHRLSAGKLAAILEMGAKVLPPYDLDVEIEYEDTEISQYPVTSFEAAPNMLRVKLGTRHTDCLAREACGIDAACCGDSCCS